MKNGFYCNDFFRKVEREAIDLRFAELVNDLCLMHDYMSDAITSRPSLVKTQNSGDLGISGQVTVVYLTHSGKRLMRIYTRTDGQTDTQTDKVAIIGAWLHSALCPKNCLFFMFSADQTKVMRSRS